MDFNRAWWIGDVSETPTRARRFLDAIHVGGRTRLENIPLRLGKAFVESQLSLPLRDVGFPNLFVIGLKMKQLIRENEVNHSTHQTALTFRLKVASALFTGGGGHRVFLPCKCKCNIVRICKGKSGMIKMID